MASSRASKSGFFSKHPRIEALGMELAARTAALLVWSVPTGTIAAGAAAAITYLHAQTPLDWLITETLGSLTLIGLACTWSLLSVRPPARPDGIKLATSDAPDLFTAAKRCVAHYRVGRLDAIVVGDLPEIRFDPLTRSALSLSQGYTLYVGWPLLCSLDTDQFRLALRCAVGQWSSWQAGARSAFICQQVRFWNMLRAHYEGRTGLAVWLVGKPITLFAGWLATAATEICRSQAFVHDHVGQISDGEDAMAALLITQAVSRTYLETRYWPWIMGAAVRTPEPVVKPFTNFFSITEQLLTRDDANRWVLQSMSTMPETSTASLRERLSALGHTGARWTGFPVLSAATSVFGQRWPALAARLDESWREQVRAQWRDSHDQFQRESREFYSLKVKAKCESVVGSEALRYLRLAEKFVKPDERVTLYKNVLRDNRIWPDVCFQCGRLLLAAGDAAGTRALEQAMQLDQSYANQASGLIAAFETQNRIVPLQHSALAVAG